MFTVGARSKPRYRRVVANRPGLRNSSESAGNHGNMGEPTVSFTSTGMDDLTANIRATVVDDATAEASRKGIKVEVCVAEGDRRRGEGRRQS